MIPNVLMFIPAVIVLSSAGLAAALRWLVSQSRRAKAARMELTDVERTAVGVCFSRCKTSCVIKALEGPLWDPSSDQAIVDHVLSNEDERRWLDRFYLSKPVLGGQEESWENMVAIRTTFIDQTAITYVVEQGIKQVVIIGAGLDCRAWRLPWPDGVQVWEVDSGSVEAFKLRALHGKRIKAGARKFVKMDLNDDGGLPLALSAAGHDASLKTLWIAEGLIGYLHQEAGNTLMKEMISSCSTGSRLVMTCPPTETERAAAVARGRPLFHVTFEEASSTVERLEKAGWSVHLRTSESLAVQYNVPGLRPQEIMVASF